MPEACQSLLLLNVLQKTIAALRDTRVTNERNRQKKWLQTIIIATLEREFARNMPGGSVTQTERYSDVSIVLTTFFLKSVGLWKAEDRAVNIRMYLMIVCTMYNMILGLVTEARDVYFTWYYKGDILYTFTNFVSTVMAFLKVNLILMHKNEFLGLLKFMEEKFLNVNYDSHEKIILHSCKRKCVLFVCCVTTIGVCAMLSYLLTPFIIQASKNDSERILPFNMWLKLPLSTTPYYEILFGMQFVALYFIGVCYFCFDNAFCILSVHVSGQFRILQYRFSKLCGVNSEKCEETDLILAKHADRSYEKLRDCIQHHQSLLKYCERLENVYTMIILGQVLMLSLLLCLFGCQVLLAKCTFARRVIFIYLISGAMALLFMFTYSCNIVTEQSGNVAIGAYSALWTIMPMNKSGKLLRKDLLFVLSMCKRACCLTAYGFFPVSLETCTTILSTAASYFALLRSRLDDS